MSEIELPVLTISKKSWLLNLQLATLRAMQGSRVPVLHSITYAVVSGGRNIRLPPVGSESRFFRFFDLQAVTFSSQAADLQQSAGPNPPNGREHQCGSNSRGPARAPNRLYAEA